MSDETNIVEPGGDLDGHDPGLDQTPDDDGIDGIDSIGFVPGAHAVAWVDPLPELDPYD